MVSELLRHSDRPEMCERVPERLRLCHRPKQVTRDDAPVAALSKAKAIPLPRMNDLFVNDAGWQLGPLAPVALTEEYTVDGEGLLDLDEF